MAIQLRHMMFGLLLTVSAGVWADDLYRDDVYVWESHQTTPSGDSHHQTTSNDASRSERKTIIIVDKKDEKSTDNQYKSGKKTDPNWQKQTADQATVTIVDKK